MSVLSLASAASSARSGITNMTSTSAMGQVIGPVRMGGQHDLPAQWRPQIVAGGGFPAAVPLGARTSRNASRASLRSGRTSVGGTVPNLQHVQGGPGSGFKGGGHVPLNVDAGVYIAVPVKPTPLPSTASVFSGGMQSPFTHQKLRPVPPPSTGTALTYPHQHHNEVWHTVAGTDASSQKVGSCTVRGGPGSGSSTVSLSGIKGFEYPPAPPSQSGSSRGSSRIRAGRRHNPHQQGSTTTRGATSAPSGTAVSAGGVLLPELSGSGSKSAVERSAQVFGAASAWASLPAVSQQHSRLSTKSGGGGTNEEVLAAKRRQLQALDRRLNALKEEQSQLYSV